MTDDGGGRIAVVIELQRLSEFPREQLVQASPVTAEQARQWASSRQAERVWYWEKTKSAFILAG